MAALIRLARPFQQTSLCACSQLSAVGNQRYNSNRASLVRVKKPHYVRTYPTTLVFADGSSVTIRYEKPRKIIQLPVDPTQISEEERNKRNLILYPPKKIKVRKENEQNYDTTSYVNMIKKKK